MKPELASWITGQLDCVCSNNPHTLGEVVATKALDLVTMGYALRELGKTHFGDAEWQGVNDQQQLFLSWYCEHSARLGELGGLDALASRDFAELNSFLTSRRFKPGFEPFDGIGVAAILDMLVEWSVRGALTTIRKYDRSADQQIDYPAFQLGAEGVDVFEVEGFSSRSLVRLRTKTGHSLWLIQAPEPRSEIELAETVQRLIVAERQPSSFWTVGAVVPMLEIDLQVNLSWMLGLNATARDGRYALEQAFQQFKLRANEDGARVKVATGFVPLRSLRPTPKPYKFTDPFIGFFTQPGHDSLAMAAFYADVDSWRNPTGTLEDL